MTHLAQTRPVAAFTDLNETVTEEALEHEEINEDLMTPSPPAVRLGEPVREKHVHNSYAFRHYHEVWFAFLETCFTS